MKKFLVPLLALLTLGCVPRVPVRIPPRVVTSVPKINPVTLPKAIPTTSSLPKHLTMPLEKLPPVRTIPTGTAGKGKGDSLLKGLGDNLPVDQIFGGGGDDERERKKAAATPRLPR
jgi:hypothetical protein